MGFEDSTTEVLTIIRSNLLNDLEIIGEHVSAGTFKVSKKEGSAPPSQAGWLTLVLLLGVEDELEGRIKGFERALDPKLFPKTL